MSASESPQQEIPKEIQNFFRGETGRTFIIKGKPRCGKTTFALQLAHELWDPQHIYYIATRGTNEPLYAKYEWLKAHDEKMKALSEEPVGQQQSAVQAGPPGNYPQQQYQQQPGQPQSARALLESILKDTASSMQQPGPQPQPVPQPGSKNLIDRSHLNMLLQGADYRELEAVYRGIERSSQAKSFVLINRIDRLAAKYGVDMEALVKVLVRDLVMDRNTYLVLVLNKVDSGLDHLSDGIITLKEFGGGMVFIGQCELNKLSGIEMKQNKYLYNLLDGKFKLLKGITHWG
jgi:DNA polymerase III delta prime subunit